MNHPTIIKVLTELEKRKGSWKRVCADSGVGYPWLIAFVRGRIPNPGILTLDKLEKYLFPKDSSRPE